MTSSSVRPHGQLRPMLHITPNSLTVTTLRSENRFSKKERHMEATSLLLSALNGRLNQVLFFIISYIIINIISYSKSLFILHFVTLYIYIYDLSQYAKQFNHSQYLQSTAPTLLNITLYNFLLIILYQSLLIVPNELFVLQSNII